MNRHLDEIKIVVEGLRPQDRKNLLDHLALLQKDAVTSSRRQNRDVDLWCAALSDAIRRDSGALGILTPSLGVLRRVVAPLFSPIEVFMEGAKLQKLKVPERQAIYNLLARLLVAHARQVSSKLRAPISLKFVVSCSNAIPGLFENAFPGYLDAGLASVVATGFQNRRN